jgi:anti-anti-sigma regulatory factor
MGLQNATITRISSGVVRTTHVTGVLTDIGLEVVQTAEAAWDALRKRRVARQDGDPRTVAAPVLAVLRVQPNARRLALLSSIVGSFVLGAGLGVVVFEHVSSNWAMFPPVLFLAWFIAQDLRKPIAEIEPSELVARAGLDLPDWLGVYHLANDRTHGIVSLGEHGATRGAMGGADRSTVVQRLPDLVAWLEVVPEHVRVIVLDLTDVAALDEDAGLQIRAAILTLREQGRRLIVAGVTNEQYRQLRKAGAGDVLDPASACPDLELAIARALA